MKKADRAMGGARRNAPISGPGGWGGGGGRWALLLAALLAGCTVVGVPAGGPPSPPSNDPAADAPPPAARPPVARPPADRPAAPPPVIDVARTMTPARTFPEVRAMWVVRTTMQTADAVRTMVRRAEAAGVNTLILQVRGRGDAYYRSRWEPRGERVEGGAGFDPLALAIEEAHGRGMAVHAWVNTHLVWSGQALPTSPEHLVRAHPEWLAVPRDLGRALHGMDPRDPSYVQALLRHATENADRVEGIYSSPSDPRVQERVYSVWMDLAERYDLDGIHFDYVRYPSGDYDHSADALRRFRAWVAPRLSPERLRELDAAAAADPYAFVDALPGPWGEFRRSVITGLVERIYHGVKARRPDMVVSAAVFANQVDAVRSRHQEWPRWLAEGILDVAVPMAYTPDDGTYRTQIREARAAAGQDARLWAGVGAYLNGTDGSLAKVRIAREEGAGGVVLFSYDWMVGEGATPGGPTVLEQVGRAAFGGR